LEKIGFVSGKGKEKMRKKFWGSKKEVLMITNSNHAYLFKKRVVDFRKEFSEHPHGETLP
jgi:hypothetical protein